MKQLVLTALGLFVAAGAVQAQVGVFQRPPTTPTRPGVNPLFSQQGSGGIFGTGSPFGAMRPGFGGPQVGFSGVPTGDQPAAPVALGVTGHPVRFFYYSHYYTFPAPKYGPGSSGVTPTNLLNQPGTGQTFGMAPPLPGIGIVIGGRRD